MTTTTRTLLTPDGPRFDGAIHPEIADPGLKALVRDLRLLRTARVSSFFRHPYGDIDEAEAYRALAAEQGRVVPSDPVLMAVFRVDDETNARIMVSALEAADLMEKGLADLRAQASRTPSGKGFA